MVAVKHFAGFFVLLFFIIPLMDMVSADAIVIPDFDVFRQTTAIFSIVLVPILAFLSWNRKH